MTDNKENIKNVLVFGLVIASILTVAVGAVEFVRRSGGGVPSEPSVIAENPQSQPFPRELTDASGDKLLIDQKPKRIVSQTLGTDEILLGICSPKRIVALSSLADDRNYSNVVEKSRSVSLKTIQGAEQILYMEPDLIFVASYSRAETVQLLKASKAPIFRFANFNSIKDIKDNIRTVGFATGCDLRASELIAKVNSDLRQIRQRIPQLEKPLRVMSFTSGYTAGEKTLFDDMLRAVGAVNVSAESGISGFAKISVEKIAEWQPDFIVAGANNGELESAKKRLLSDPVIKVSKAGKAERIIVIDNRHYLTVSHNIVKGVEDLFTGLYGKQIAK